MPNPIVSIVLPIYNAEKYIDKTIQSIKKQSVQEWELLLIDDGSSDGSLVMINKFAIRDYRIKIYSQPNSGPSSARNLGIKYATGKYTTFIDADDTVEPFYLKSLLEVIEIDSGVELVCAGYYEQSIYNKEGLPLHDFEKYRPREIINQEEFISNLLNGVTGVLWAKLFVTEIILKNNITLPLELKLSEDLVFVAKYVKCISKIALSYDYIYFYNRLDESGLSRRFDESYLDNFILFNKLISEELSNNKLIGQKLQLKTALNLVKTLKDQSTTPKNLKYYHQMIEKKIGLDSLSYLPSFSDRLYIFLQNKGLYNFAFLQEKIYHILKKLKHA